MTPVSAQSISDWGRRSNDGQCPLRVKSRRSHRKKPCLLYPWKRTCAGTRKCLL